LLVDYPARIQKAPRQLMTYAIRTPFGARPTTVNWTGSLLSWLVFCVLFLEGSRLITI